MLLIAGTKYSAGGAAIFEFANGNWSETAVVTAPKHLETAYDYFGSCVVAGNGILGKLAPSLYASIMLP